MLLKCWYILIKILGISVFIVPILLSRLNYITDLSTFTIIVLMIVGLCLIVFGDLFEKKYKQRNQYQQDNKLK